MNRAGLERLDSALAAIEAEPRRWRQRQWFTRTSCGTTCCLAGMVAVQAGWEPTDWDLNFYGDGSGDVTYQVGQAGVERHVRSVAQELLGITDREADFLFFGDNDLAELKLIRDNLAREVSGE